MAAELRARLGAALPYIISVVIGLTSLGFTVVYATTTAHRQDAQSHRQDVTITRLNATIAQLRAQQGLLRRQQLAGCASAADIGSVPLQSAPKPSRLGVSLVVDFRHQWRALHCPGVLPVPPGLAGWAAFYHLPGN